MVEPHATLTRTTCVFAGMCLKLIDTLFGAANATYEVVAIKSRDGAKVQCVRVQLITVDIQYACIHTVSRLLGAERVPTPSYIHTYLYIPTDPISYTVVASHAQAYIRTRKFWSRPSHG